MTISKKGKRRITVGTKKYLWWIFDEVDQTEFDGIQVKIIAEDQSLYIKYGLQQASENRFIVLSMARTSDKIQLYCPKFENDSGIVSPRGVAEMILWCSKPPTEKDIRSIRHGYSGKHGVLGELQTHELYSTLRAHLNDN